MFIKYVPRCQDIYQCVNASLMTNCQCKAMQRILVGFEKKPLCCGPQKINSISISSLLPRTTNIVSTDTNTTAPASTSTLLVLP